MEKDQKTTMLDRVKERLQDDNNELSNTQEKLRLKQKQIAEKLLGECGSQGIKAELTTSIMNAEPIYTIKLSYDLSNTYVSRIIIEPVVAVLGKEQGTNCVYFFSYKNKSRTKMNDVASIFRAIEDDMYFYYKHK
jgi:hypothetical protein